MRAGGRLADQTVLRDRDGRNGPYHLASYSDGRYTLAVENSQLIICELGSFCEDGGSFFLTDTQIVFDPDTSPKPFVYSVAGDVLTLTGIASNGSEVVFTLVRAPGGF